MKIDWMLVVTATGPLAAVFLTIFMQRLLERRVNLISFMAHAMNIPVVPTEGAPSFTISTHTIIVRNAGRLPAHNVRIGHAQLPDARSITPSMAYTVEVHPSVTDIVLPVLRPGEQFAIAYLYTAPLAFRDINRYVKSDETVGKIVKVLIAPRTSPWIRWSSHTLMTIGGVAVIYVFYGALRVAM